MTETNDPQGRSSRSRAQDETAPNVRGLQHRNTSPAWLARAAGIGLSVVSVGFVLLLPFVIGRYGELSLITRPLPVQITFVLPYVIAALTVATTIGTVLAWWNQYWSLRARLHQTILALLGLGFSWQLATLGFLAL
ncbi:hypothetical protein [Natrinema sp. 1APR25-10V2]|uniref:hypothetical protein n=1 Tax=Natrinema sp. 1APR25-10V2 TaxID=2951081 RepID=UPI0028749F56|nr:hypothetical protein [Natrinema sp. 1APR25-10V2]MDS0477195.1 hypothetical protein [Natrinema sp. 1APR25-10V2]